MILTNNMKLYLDKLLLIIILIFPFSLLSGPFLTDLFLSFFSFFFLIILIYYRKWKYVNNIYFKITIIWYFYILLNSLFSENRLLSLESSLFYFRFIIFSFGFYYILEENKKTILYFTVSLLIAFSFILVDSLNTIRLGGYKLGFWFSQQGSIYIFVILIFYYARKMGEIDKKYHANEN